MGGTRCGQAWFDKLTTNKRIERILTPAVMPPADKLVRPAHHAMFNTNFGVQ
jgi:hypothetical protein